MSLGRTRKKMAQRQRRGAAVVEFAFVAPLMILLTMGADSILRIDL